MTTSDSVKVRQLGVGYGRVKKELVEARSEIEELKEKLDLVTRERDHWKGCFLINGGMKK